MKPLNRDCVQHFTPAGSGIRPIYILDPVTNEPVIDHEEDLDKIIQSYANDVAIDRIMARHMLGDESVSNAVSPINDINKPGDLDLTFLKDIRDPGQLANLQMKYLLGLYDNYKGDKSMMTFDKFAKAITDGDFAALNIKKEVTEDAKSKEN